MSAVRGVTCKQAAHAVPCVRMAHPARAVSKPETCSPVLGALGAASSFSYRKQHAAGTKHRLRHVSSPLHSRHEWRDNPHLRPTLLEMHQQRHSEGPLLQAEQTKHGQGDSHMTCGAPCVAVGTQRRKRVGGNAPHHAGGPNKHSVVHVSPLRQPHGPRTPAHQRDGRRPPPPPGTPRQGATTTPPLACAALHTTPTTPAQTKGHHKRGQQRAASDEPMPLDTTIPLDATAAGTPPASAPAPQDSAVNTLSHCCCTYKHGGDNTSRGWGVGWRGACLGEQRLSRVSLSKSGCGSQRAHWCVRTASHQGGSAILSLPPSGSQGRRHALFAARRRERCCQHSHQRCARQVPCMH
jgi:hypothetical protein